VTTPTNPINPMNPDDFSDLWPSGDRLRGGERSSRALKFDADVLINRILDAEAEGEVLDVRDLVRDGEASSKGFRARLDATRASVGKLALLPQGPDLTAKILARVEASERPFVVRPQRARARRGRLLAACGALAVLSLVAVVQRLYPDALSWSRPQRPVTDLVAAARSDVSVTLDSIQGAFQQVGTDLSSPVSRLARQATRSANSGRVAIALMPLPSDEVGASAPGVPEAAGWGVGALTLEGSGVYDSKSLGSTSLSPLGSSTFVASDAPPTRELRESAVQGSGLTLGGIAGAADALASTQHARKHAGTAQSPRPLMLLSENPLTCAMLRIEPERLTDEMLDGPSSADSPSRLLPWLDLSRLMQEADGKETGRERR